MGKQHTEEAVIPILLRKGILVNSATKQIGIPPDTQIGNKVHGKLDFMRKMKWQIIKNATKEQVGLANYAGNSQKLQFKKQRREKQEKDSMKESFKKKKKKFFPKTKV